MSRPDPAARAELLARLPALGFVPPEEAALWSRAARSAAFAAAVEAFAAAYWSLPPDERRGRYNQLWEGRSGPAAARLGILGTGLDLAAEDGTGGTTPADVVRTVLLRRPTPPHPPPPALLPWVGDGDDPPFDDPTPVTPDEADPAAMSHYDAREQWLAMWLARAVLWPLMILPMILVLLCLLSNFFR